MPASASDTMKREQNFINKTWAMVNGGHPEISWDETGTLIVVKNPERLAAHVLPMYFRHNQYASWVRALNAHDFKKSGPDRWQHQYFVQDQPDLLVQIKRKAAPARSSATGRASGSDTSAGSSTAIVRVPKRSYSPARLDRLEQQLVTADILNEERKSLWVMQQQMVQMETSLADVTDETFRQRFDTVRLMHMMLQRLLVVPDPSAGPPIRLHPRHSPLQLTDGCSPSKLAAAAEGDVAMGDGALGDVAMDDVALGSAPILSDAGMLVAHDGAPSRLRELSSEELLRMLTTSSIEPAACNSPWKSQRPSAGAAATAGAPSSASSASSSSSSSAAAAAAVAAGARGGGGGGGGGAGAVAGAASVVWDGTEVLNLTPGLVNLTPDLVNSRPGVLPGTSSLPTSQIASIAAKLPQIPPNLLRDVSFDQLPPKGSAQREQVEAAIDWYFQQLSIATSSAIQAMSPEGTMPATAPLLSASSHVATSHSAANVFTANVFTSPPPLVAQMSAMSEVSSIGSSIGSSVVELASSLDLHNLHDLHNRRDLHNLHDLPGH